jgi:hypothetical protein
MLGLQIDKLELIKDIKLCRAASMGNEEDAHVEQHSTQPPNFLEHRDMILGTAHTSASLMIAALAKSKSE